MLILTIILGLLAAAFAALWLMPRKHLKSAAEQLRRLRPGQPGRRPRRGGNPRRPADLYRRDAGAYYGWNPAERGV